MEIQFVKVSTLYIITSLLKKLTFKFQEADRTFTKAEGMLAQSVILDLKENDNVSVYAYHGNIRDGGWHYTHFTGYLLF